MLLRLRPHTTTPWGRNQYPIAATRPTRPERFSGLDTDLIRHFLETFASEAKLTLHARLLSGINDHHKVEALFKALGRALRMATGLDPRRTGMPSTKGTLTA